MIRSTRSKATSPITSPCIKVRSCGISLADLPVPGWQEALAPDSFRRQRREGEGLLQVQSDGGFSVTQVTGDLDRNPGRRSLSLVQGGPPVFSGLKRRRLASFEFSPCGIARIPSFCPRLLRITPRKDLPTTSDVGKVSRRRKHSRPEGATLRNLSKAAGPAPESRPD